MGNVVGKDKLTQSVKEILAAQGTNVSARQIAAVIEASMEAIIEAVDNGDTVQLIGFGTFEPRSRKERAGRNINSGEMFTIPAMNTVAFSPARAFKDVLNGKVTLG